jgi:hypothetical protein
MVDLISVNLPSTEPKITLKQARILLGGLVSARTIRRWCTVGLKGADGRLIQLQAEKVGGPWVTSRGALQRFMVEKMRDL